MGSGIALVAAQAGYSTILYELDPGILAKARAGIQQGLQRLADKNKIRPEDKEAIFQRLHFTGDLQSCLADIFIEAIIEKPEIKIALFNQLAEINHSECIFATNTSSLSVNHLAAQIMHPERVIGMHFFNPAPVMKLVEVVNSQYTNEETTRIVYGLAQQLGKTPVICKDAPGFIVNRVARPYYIESLRLAEEEQSRPEQLDRLLEATGFKMGPFRLMDLIGNDINYAVSCSVYEQLLRPERLRPSFLQERKVRNGELGRKTGKGYYDYNLTGEGLKS